MNRIRVRSKSDLILTFYSIKFRAHCQPYLQEEEYMEHPIGFVIIGKEHKVLKL
jgi:hypothetical protein